MSLHMQSACPRRIRQNCADQAKPDGRRPDAQYRRVPVSRRLVLTLICTVRSGLLRLSPRWGSCVISSAVQPGGQDDALCCTCPPSRRPARKARVLSLVTAHGEGQGVLVGRAHRLQPGFDSARSAMLYPVETPEIERRAVEDYLKSQSGPGFAVEHVEKLTSEYVLGRQYDVWDAHTNEGRWWVITPPTNLYSQDQIKSMDIALSFHIGLMSRVMAHNPVRSEQNSSRTWILEVIRRLDTAGDNLDRAKEVEDVQAVGMRLRETLLTLTDRLRSLDLQMPRAVELPQQDGNFKGWADVYAGILAPGASSARLRKTLKTQSDHTWEYLGWLTHARNASTLDGRLAYSLTSGLVEAFLLALERLERSADERCPACSSYQISRQYAGDGDWVQFCSTCGWQIPADTPEPIETEPEESGDATVGPPPGDCVVVEDFGIYITPGQARNILEEAAARAVEDEDEQPNWTNPFTVRFPEDGSMRDVHRLVFRSPPRAYGRFGVDI